MQGLAEITRQSVLFPVYYQDGETWEERRKRVQDMQYVVKDDLLYACIGWINEIDSGKKIAGMRQSKWTVGHVVLLMALREAFDLHRFPFCEDRILSDLALARGSVAEEFLKLLPELTSERITKLTHEVAQLYHHTQHQLEKANGGSTPEPQKIPSPEIERCNNGVEVDHFPVGIERVMPVQQDMPPRRW